MRLLAVVVTSTLFAACGGGDEKVKQSTLEAWGINPDLGAAVDANGKPVAASYNPLGQARPVMFARKGLFLSGLNWNVSGTAKGSFALALPQTDSSNTYTVPSWSDPDATWAQNPHASAACDLDGSGLEKAVSVVFVPDTSIKVGDNTGTAKLEIVDGKSTRVEVQLDGTFHLIISGDTDERHYLVSLACGDLDADGAQELAAVIGNTLVFLDDARRNYRPILGAPIDYRNGDTSNAQFHPTRVAAGDVNGDGVDEVVTIDGTEGSSGSRYYVYGGASAARLATGIILSTGTPSVGMQFGNVALGDLDADGLQEVVFAGHDTDSSQLNVVLAKWDAAAGDLAFSRATYQRSGSWTNQRVPALVCFKGDVLTPTSGGDPRLASPAYTKARVIALNSILTYDSETLRNDPFNGATGVDTAYKGLIAAGDVNGDDRDEVVLFNLDNRNMRVYGTNSGNTFQNLAGSVDTGMDSAYVPSLCLPDLAGNSLVLAFQGPSELRFSDPKVVAVLASPPYWDESVDRSAIGNCGTTIGKSSSTSTDSTASFSVHAGWTYGVAFEAPLVGTSGASSKITSTFGVSFSFSASKGMQRSITRSFTALAGEDHVIFSSVPFDVYTYKILRSPNADVIGKTLTVSVPRAPQLLATEKSLFNALPENPTRIDGTVLTHVIGDPTKYMSLATMESLAGPGGFYDPTGVGITNGSGYATDEVSQGSSKATTVGGGVSFEYATEATLGGALFGSRYGFSASYAYQITTVNGTTITGQIPYNKAGTPTSKGFQTGIGAYGAHVPSQKESFIVVTYWKG